MSASGYLPDIHRLLPQSLEAEKATLSCLTLSPREVAGMLTVRSITAEHFHHPAHGEAFSVLMERAIAGDPLDFITVAGALRDRGKLDAVGGAAFVSELFTFLPTAANAGYYLDSLTEKHLLRQIIHVGTEYAARSYEEQGDPLALAHELHGRVTQLVCHREAHETVASALEAIKFEVINGEPDGSILTTGWDVLDKRLVLYVGDLLLISAPTSCGKSALALQIVLNLAMRGRRAAFYPLEMSTKATMKRALSILGDDRPDFIRQLVKNDAGKDGSFAAGKVKNFVATYGTLKMLPIYVRDDLHDFDAIVADVRMQHAKARLSFVCIDYLQLIRVAGKWERRQLSIAHITQCLKALAKELQIVVCVPSQVNKDGGTREAQDAENDASALLKIIAKESKDGDPEFDRLQIWKQREGQRFVDIPVSFNGPLTRFETA